MRFHFINAVKTLVNSSSCGCTRKSQQSHVLGKSAIRSIGRREIAICPPGKSGNFQSTSNFRLLSNVSQQTECKTSPLIEESQLQKIYPQVNRFVYFLSHLKSLSKYKKTFFNPDEESFKVTTCVSNFVREAGRVDIPFITDSCFDNLVTDVLSNVDKLSQEELLTVLFYLGKFPLIENVREVKYKKIWKTLDVECAGRQMDFDRVFQFTDLFYNLNVQRMSDFHWSGVKKGLRKLDILSKEHFVRLMFCLAAITKLPESINTYPIEFNLKRLIDCMSTEEIAISCLAIKKVATSIVDKQLVQHMLEIIAKKSKTISSHAVESVSEITQASAHFRIAPAIYSFQETMSAEIDRLPFSSAIQLGLVGFSVGTPQKMIRKVFSKVNDININYVRIKDLAKLCQLMVRYGDRCPELEQKIIADLRSPFRERQLQISNFATHFPIIVNYLSVNGILEEDFFAKVLSPEFLQICYDNVMYRFRPEIMLLDLTAEIELPNYKGPRLTTKQQGYLLKKNMFWLNWLSRPPKKSEPEYMRVVRSLVETAEIFLGGPKFLFTTNVLPQFAFADVVFCTDSSGKFSEIPQCYYETNKEEHLVKRIPDTNAVKDKQFHVLMVISRSCCFYNSKEIKGETKMQIRQIAKLGYTVHKVFASDWTTLTEQSQKLNYLSEIALNSKHNGEVTEV